VGLNLNGSKDRNKGSMAQRYKGEGQTELIPPLKGDRGMFF